MRFRLELIYDDDCPNVPAAREALRQACEQAGISPEWHEWDRADSASPTYAAQYGSPTVLVDGEDVAGSNSQSDAQACRVYRTDAGQMLGAPPPEWIAARLAGEKRVAEGTWFGALAAAGAGLASLLPVLSCPACWPAYAGILGALGVSFVDYTPYVLPVMSVMLGLAVASLAMGARRRHGHGPLTVGLIATVALVVGRFAIPADGVVYAGAAILLAATVWNAWPVPSATSDNCTSCSA